MLQLLSRRDHCIRAEILMCLFSFWLFPCISSTFTYLLLTYFFYFLLERYILLFLFLQTIRSGDLYVVALG